MGSYAVTLISNPNHIKEKCMSLEGKKVQFRIAFAVALALGFIVPVLTTRPPDGSSFSPWQSWTVWREGMRIYPVPEAESALVTLCELMPPRPRIGYVVHGTLREFMTQDVEVQRYFVAQYVLSPAVLKLIHVPLCIAFGAAGCDLTSVDFILMRGVGKGPFSNLIRELEFTPTAEAGGFVLFSRRLK